MSDSLSAYYDDVAEYERRCAKYQEVVQRDKHGPKCYDEHADWLAALESRDLIRSGAWDPCNWSPHHAAKYQLADLDSVLDAKRGKAPKTIEPAPSGGISAPFSLRTTDQGKSRFELLELD